MMKTWLRVDNKIEIWTVFFYKVEGKRKWYSEGKDKHDALGIACVPLLKEYHENYGKMPGDDIQQNETPLTSCGASGAMHAYYKIVEGKDAHAEDFWYDYIDEIRLFLADKIREHGFF